MLDDPEWAEQLTDADLRGLTPLFWSNINPYGTFRRHGPQARPRHPGSRSRGHHPRIATLPLGTATQGEGRVARGSGRAGQQPFAPPLSGRIP
jgi:hypothetical protein